MMKLLLSLLVAVSSLSTAHADDTPAPPKVMVLDGVTGTWFRAESVKRFLLIDTQLTLANETIKKQASLLDLANQEIDLTIQLKDNALEVGDLTSKQLGHEVERRQSAESSRDSWLRSPVLWFSVGVVLASTVFVVAK